MKISGFTIVRNARKFNYPVRESIKSILPICDEFIVNVGDSEDDTLSMIKSIQDAKVRIVETKWEKMDDVLSYQTNIALNQCKGDWAFYLQSDEVIHEKDLPRLKKCMGKFLNDEDVDTLRLSWLHFYGSYYRYRIDRGWFQKQDRIIRNNGEIESCVDAWRFQRKDGKPLRRKNTRCLLYHYGWVQPGDVMTQRRVNAEQLYESPELRPEERRDIYQYGDLGRFPAYFGSHPKTMSALVQSHAVSCKDKKEINKRFWWHPFKWLKIRYKTFRRVKEKIE